MVNDGDQVKPMNQNRYIFSFYVSISSPFSISSYLHQHCITFSSSAIALATRVAMMFLFLALFMSVPTL